MESDLAELSSIASLLAQLTERVTALAESASAAKKDDVASDLIAVERALTGAGRRLDRLVVGRPPGRRS